MRQDGRTVLRARPAVIAHRFRPVRFADGSVPGIFLVRTFPLATQAVDAGGAVDFFRRGTEAAVDARAADPFELPLAQPARHVLGVERLLGIDRQPDAERLAGRRLIEDEQALGGSLAV